MNPKYPVYVISKGRWESRLTVKALEKRNVPFHVVIEPQEFDQYAAVIDPKKIYVLPFSNLGQGSIPARNWVWEHSIGIGAKRHWILDDNIQYFFYLSHCRRWYTTDGTSFAAAEEMVDRYTNVALAGMQYDMFLPRRQKFPPLILNTRIYSCILIDNAMPFRWRGRYNEDTDLSLRCLKAGFCTMLFNTFSCDKIATLTMKGGNTDELYAGDGRLKMAESLRDQHPDVTKIVWKWGRWQHSVDYTPFKANTPRLRGDIIVPTGVNNFGMKLVKKDADYGTNQLQGKRRSSQAKMDA